MRKRLLIATGALACLLCASVAYSATITGTNGPDTLFGTIHNDTIDAKGGALDIVVGLSGNDRLRGGSGPDQIQGDATCPRHPRDLASCNQRAGFGDDVIEGDSGDDVVGAGAGRDRVSGGSGVDDVTGGRGNDVLSGGSGNDIVRGSSGRDTITGGSGADKLFGDSGNDTLLARDRRRDRVDCGSGRDVVFADRKDKVGRNCERVLRR